MATEITVQNLDVQGNKLVVTEQTVPIPDIDDIPKTPLASVPESASADTVVVITNGTPRQTPLSDLKTEIGVPTSADEISFDPDKAAYLTETNVQDAIDELYEKCSGKVGRLAVNIGGIAVTSAENGWYYSANIPITGLPSGAIPFSVTPYGSFDIGVIPQLRDNANLVLQSARSLTTTSGRLAVVGYYIP